MREVEDAVVACMPPEDADSLAGGERYAPGGGIGLTEGCAVDGPELPVRGERYAVDAAGKNGSSNEMVGMAWPIAGVGYDKSGLFNGSSNVIEGSGNVVDRVRRWLSILAGAKYGSSGALNTFVDIERPCFSS